MTESLCCAAKGSTKCKSPIFPLKKKLPQTGTERRFQSPVNLFWLRLFSSFPHRLAHPYLGSLSSAFEGGCGKGREERVDRAGENID